MRRITFLLFTVATLAGVAGYTATASRFSAQEPAPIFLTKIPTGYRAWQCWSIVP